MGNIGETAEIINATKVHLDLGADRHILLQEISGEIGRDEDREAVDAGAVYFYGQHNNYFDATLLLSSPEINTFVGYTVLDANGALPENDFKLILTDVSGSTKTITVTCTMPKFPFDKPIEGGVKIRPRFRIIEEVTTADIT